MGEDIKNLPENIESSTALVTETQKPLNEESKELVAQIIASTDEQQTKDLTYLFNVNQNKKTMVRIDKLSGLQDGLVDQFVKRIQERPDEISNKELMDGLRIVQDIIERGQRQVSETDQQQPLIQINQQNNSINVGEQETTLDRASRERVKNAVLGLLSGLSQAPVQTEANDTYVSSEFTTEEDTDNDV